jgi:phosphohistidine phosphatase
MTMGKRILTLIRHAEATSAHGSRIRDCDRPLSERGRRDALQLGTRLAGTDFAPDRVWCSDAERALVSAKILSQVLSFPAGFLEPRPSLYLAHSATLREIISEADPEIHSLALVGHNPGLSELVDWLCDKNGFGLPTCGIARLELAIRDWSQLEEGCGDLVEFGRPEPDLAPLTG